MKRMAQEILIQRGIRKWTQQDLANRIGTTQRTVAAWENGTSVPRRAMQVRIAQAFGMPEDSFFPLGEENEPAGYEPETPEHTEIDDKLSKVKNVLSQEQTGLSEQEKEACLKACREALKSFGPNDAGNVLK